MLNYSSCSARPYLILDLVLELRNISTADLVSHLATTSSRRQCSASSKSQSEFTLTRCPCRQLHSHHHCLTTYSHLPRPFCIFMSSSSTPSSWKMYCGVERQARFLRMPCLTHICCATLKTTPTDLQGLKGGCAYGFVYIWFEIYVCSQRACLCVEQAKVVNCTWLAWLEQ